MYINVYVKKKKYIVDERIILFSLVEEEDCVSNKILKINISDSGKIYI